MRLSTLASVISLTGLVSSTSVLLPLYIDPASNAWNPVFSAVQAYPNILFYIIVNPDSGPGNTACPDGNYAPAVSKLNTFANVYTVGYVDTAYTQRPYSDVTADIDAYASWANSCTTPSQNVTIDGIFFDDVVNTDGTSEVTYMQNASSYAYATIPTSQTFVVFNPGTPAPDIYFQYADFIVEYEVLPKNYKNQTSINAISPEYRPQSSIILHNVTNTNNLASWIQTACANNIGTFYSTPDGYYMNLSQLKTVAADLAAC